MGDFRGDCFYKCASNSAGENEMRCREQARPACHQVAGFLVTQFRSGFDTVNVRRDNSWLFRSPLLTIVGACALEATNVRYTRRHPPQIFRPWLAPAPPLLPAGLTFLPAPPYRVFGVRAIFQPLTICPVHAQYGAAHRRFPVGALRPYVPHWGDLRTDHLIDPGKAEMRRPPTRQTIELLRRASVISQH